MKLSEVMRIAWEAILKNKIRSVLTMLGIIIGVSAVIMMVAISAGTEATIQEQITSLGSNLLFVQSNFVRGGRGGEFRSSGGLIYEDATAIQDQVSGVKAVVVEQNASETIKSDTAQLEDVAVVGSSPGLPTVRDIEIASGRYFNEQDVQRKQKVAVLGYTIAQELFGNSNPIGQYVTVGTAKLTVIGVMAKKGSVGGTDFD
ncbi:MAG TPA: ABC transporter permease, partial [Anaerolineales bacterium]|nr:ABC transporter permease [Anaerolineales bacterium]